MLRATLRSLFAYKLRLALSGLAIVLGIAFVAGTFIFTDSLQRSFTQLTEGGKADLVIKPATAFQSDFTSGLTTLTMPDTLASEISSAAGVAEVASVVQVPNVVVIGADGKAVSGSGDPGAVGQGGSWIQAADLNEYQLTDGRAPSGSNEVVIDTNTATAANLNVNDNLTSLLPNGNIVSGQIVGVVEPTLLATRGATLVLWDLPRAEELLTSPGQVTEIRVQAADGVSQEQLKAEVTPLLPENVGAQTGDEIANDIADTLNERLGFLNTFLLVFGLIALFVSAFLIYNTFSILVAQRTKELALLRAIGATKRQVSRSVLIEALVVALVATTLGLLVGAGLAGGLKGLFSALGVPLPPGGLVFLPRTLIVAYLIGVAITMLSAFIPARRASSIPPVAAMRADDSTPQRSLVVRSVLGVVLLAVAALTGWLALANKDAAILGISAVSAIIAALALAPVVAVFVVPVLGAPFRSATGKLATENARRNPRRTAATAGALMVGLALISALSVVASSTIKSVDTIIDDVIGADYIVTGTGFAPFPDNVLAAAQDSPGIATASGVKNAIAQVPGGRADGDFITLIDPNTIGEVLDLTPVAGSLADLNQSNTVLLDTETAAQLGLKVGDIVTVTTVVGPVDLTLVGTYEPAGFFSGFTAGMSSAEALSVGPGYTAMYLTAEPGTNETEVRAALDQTLAAFPSVTVLDQAEFKEQIKSQINQILAFIVALLVLAVLIAFLGIVNTLALSVFERTREIGLLRAVGTLRSQIRRMILIESVLIAILGSLLGLVIGVLYGAGLQQTLSEEGISQLAIDVPQLLLFLAISALGGVLAALWPAFRASRLNVLKAIATE